LKGAGVAQIKVMLSAAFKEAYLQLVPQFERATGHNVETQLQRNGRQGTSMVAKVTEFWMSYHRIPLRA
jgi:hypothetical protein